MVVKKKIQMKVKPKAQPPQAKTKVKVTPKAQAQEPVKPVKPVKPAHSKAEYQEAVEELGGAIMGIEILLQEVYMQHPQFAGSRDRLVVLRDSMQTLIADVCAEACINGHAVHNPVLSKMGYINHLRAVEVRMALTSRAFNSATAVMPGAYQLQLAYLPPVLLSDEVAQARAAYSGLEIPETLRKYIPFTKTEVPNGS